MKVLKNTLGIHIGLILGNLLAWYLFDCDWKGLAIDIVTMEVVVFLSYFSRR